MMGSSLLAIPWGFTQSGLLGGLLTMFVVALVCYYTCTLIVRHGAGYSDFGELCRDYLGVKGQYLCSFTSLLVLLGALMAYDRLMSDCLYLAVNGIREYASGQDVGTSTYWNTQISPVIIFIVMFPLTNLPSFSIFVKLNSYGLLAVAYMVGYVLYTAFGVEHLSSVPVLFDANFPKFAGILTLSFFIHNCILPIIQNARHKEKALRDMGIAFIFVFLSYAMIGGIAYVAYHVYEIPEDFLNYYSSTSIGAIISRFALLLQLFTVFPLIVYIMRIQFFGLLHASSSSSASSSDSPINVASSTPSTPSWKQVLALNLVICIAVTVVSIWYPHIGDILRFTGASCGLIYVFLLPIAVHLIKTYPSRPVSASNDYRILSDVEQKRIVNEHSVGYARSGWRFWMSMVGHGALIAFGTASLVMQFV